MDIIELGLFQLENLILARSPFLFLNLSVGKVEIHDTVLKSYVERAVEIHPDRVEAYLNEQKIMKEYPIVLLCEDSQSSRRQCVALEQGGYSNVYVVEKGLQGLLVEASSLRPYQK